LEHPPSKQRIQVIVCHPSPYVMTDKWYLRNATNAQRIAAVHKTQLKALAQFISGTVKNKTLLKPDPTVPMFVTGDANINRYAVVPNSDAEKDPSAAKECCSQEFIDLLKACNAKAPDIIPDPNPDRWVPYDRKEVAKLVYRTLVERAARMRPTPVTRSKMSAGGAYKQRRSGRSRSKSARRTIRKSKSRSRSKSARRKTVRRTERR